MNLKELQKWVQEDWDNFSKEKPDPHLQLIYLFEELGEVAESIRKLTGNKERKKIEADLEGEIGDVLIAIATIANHYNVDLSSAIEKTKKKIVDRHNKGI